MSDHTTRHSSTEIPYGYCHCGCGERTRIETHSHPERGQFAGHPRKYVNGHQNRKPQPQPGDLRVCTRCDEVKPLSEYSQRKSGARVGTYYTYCRKCMSQATMQSRAKNPDYKREVREKDRAWRERNRARLAGKHLERYARDPERRRLAAKKARQRNPQRERAHTAVRRAVERGDFPPAATMVCERCQETQAAHWHHYLGYAKEFRLHVIAVCTECHGREHWVSE